MKLTFKIILAVLLAVSLVNYLGSFNIPSVESAKNLPPVNSITPTINPPYDSIVQLYVNGDFICSGVVIDEQYAVTAAHCLTDQNNDVEISPFFVRDPKNLQSTVKSKVVGVNRSIDYGLLRGNFRNFKKSPINVYYDEFASNGAFMACGFPYGQNRISCMSINPQGNYIFQILAIGKLYPGMSGGPVFNLITGNVIGVNSAAGQGFVLIAPLIGLYGSFGIEPKIK